MIKVATKHFPWCNAIKVDNQILLISILSCYSSYNYRLDYQNLALNSTSCIGRMIEIND